MNTKKVYGAIVVGAILALPLVGFAQIGIPCDGPDCGFEHLIILTNNLIQFLVFTVTVPLIAIAFMVIGANYVLNPNKESARSSAKGQFEKIGYGLFWILVAFLLVKFVLYQFISLEYKGFLDFIFA